MSQTPTDGKWLCAREARTILWFALYLFLWLFFFLMIHDSDFPFKGVIHVLFPLKTK